MKKNTVLIIKKASKQTNGQPGMYIEGIACNPSQRRG